MPDKLPEHLQKLVDDVCGLGCQRVNEIIAESQSGRDSPELAGLTPEEVSAIVDVLRRVMAVYEQQQ